MTLEELRYNVLVVEDDRITQDFLRQTFRQWLDFQVVVVDSAEAAITEIEKKDCDILLIDLNLPGMDGLEFTRWYRKKGCDGYILITTAPGSVDRESKLLRRMIQAGANDYLSKPYHPRLLDLRLEVARAHSRMMRERKVLQDALKREREYTSAILTGSSTLLAVLDQDLHLIQTNPAFREMFLGSPGAPEPEDLLDRVFGPAELSKLQEYFQSDSTDSPFSFHTNVIQDSDHKVTIRWTASAFRESGGVSFIVCSGMDVTEWTEVEEKLHYMALHDPVTGLHNRHYLADALSYALELAREEKKSALLSIDLDDFKMINDSLGHAGGDELLKKSAEILKDRTRAGDLLVRHGGDEFLMLMTGVPFAEAFDRAELIRTDFAMTKFSYNGKFVSMTTSIGLAMTEPGQDAEDLLQCADSAVYRAKTQGRNQVSVFTAETVTSEGRTNWRKRIQEGIRKRWFEVWLQPMAESNGKLTHIHETRVRLAEPGHDPIFPQMFMPLAERFRIVHDLDLYVTRRAARYLLTDPEMSVVVTVSQQSLVHPSWLPTLRQTITRAQERNRMFFQVTETDVISNLKEVREILSEMREMGFKIIIDDFGTCLSAFSYLENFPCDYLKVSGSLIQGLGSQKLSHLFVRLVTDIGRELALKTIVEKVDSDSVLQLIKDINVDLIQGRQIAPAAHPEHLMDVQKEPYQKPRLTKSGGLAKSGSLTKSGSLSKTKSRRLMKSLPNTEPDSTGNAQGNGHASGK